MIFSRAWHAVFRILTPQKVAARETAESELDLLAAQTGLDYSTAMFSYHKQRIKRLRAYLAGAERASRF